MNEQPDFFNIIMPAEKKPNNDIGIEPSVEITTKSRRRRASKFNFKRPDHNMETCVQCSNGDFCQYREDKSDLAVKH